MQFGSLNKVESALPARIREEIHQNVADPRELVAESRVCNLWLSGLERPIIEQRTAKYVRAWHEAPKARIQAVVSVVAHHEVHAWRYHQVAVMNVIRKTHGPGLC